MASLYMPEKFRNQVRFQNGQLIDLAILKPGFELARPFQNQGRFQNGQVNDLAVSKRPGTQPHTGLDSFVFVLSGVGATVAEW